MANTGRRYYGQEHLGSAFAGTRYDRASKTLAVDIGGSKLTVGLISAAGRIVTRRRVPLERVDDPIELLDMVVEQADSMLHLVGKDRLPCVGVTIPGPADPERGTWVYSPFSGIEGFPVAGELAGRPGCPVAVENDVNACALGEHARGGKPGL